MHTILSSTTGRVKKDLRNFIRCNRKLCVGDSNSHVEHSALKGLGKIGSDASLRHITSLIFALTTTVEHYGFLSGSIYLMCSIT
jgi:hypothetical protein